MGLWNWRDHGSSMELSESVRNTSNADWDGVVAIFCSTGHMRQPVTIMVAIGGIGHFVLLIACVMDFLELRPGIRQWGQFFAGGLLSIAYLALAVILTTGHGV